MQKDVGTLVQRRVLVPQSVFGMDEDDDDKFVFSGFSGTIAHTTTTSALVVFDYTGERQTFSIQTVLKWLEPDLSSLFAAL